MKRFSWARMAAFLSLACVLPATSFAEPLPLPRGEVVLTVDGKITRTNDDNAARFDMAMLEGLPKHFTRTATPWDERMTAYEGVLLRDILVAVGSKGTVMTIEALDDYHHDMLTADTQSIDVILGYKRDGEYVPIRHKGPLFIIFPFSDDPSLLNGERKNQSVWQVNRIKIQ